MVHDLYTFCLAYMYKLSLSNTPPPFQAWHASIGQTGEGAYMREHDISN